MNSRNGVLVASILDTMKAKNLERAARTARALGTWISTKCEVSLPCGCCFDCGCECEPPNLGTPVVGSSAESEIY